MKQLQDLVFDIIMWNLTSKEQTYDLLLCDSTSCLCSFLYHTTEHREEDDGICRNDLVHLGIHCTFWMLILTEFPGHICAFSQGKFLSS